MRDKNNNRNLQPKIVFRYKEEFLTLYNKGVKKFLKVLWFVSLMMSVCYFFLDREKFLDDFLITICGFFILIAFSFFIWNRTRKFAMKVFEFKNHGKKTKGYIIDEFLDDKKNLRLKVAYTYNNQKKEFVTDPVLGSFRSLLKSNEVDVYILGDRQFATNFKVALDRQKSYGERFGK